MMKLIPLLGLFGLSTHYAKELLENNFPLIIDNGDLGWEHGLVATPTYPVESGYRPTLVIVGNPYSTMSRWYQSHLLEEGPLASKATTFAEFIRTKIVFCDKSGAIKPEYAFPNPIEMWNCIVHNHVSVADQTKGFIVKDEDLLLQPEATVEAVAKWCNAEQLTVEFVIPGASDLTDQHNPIQNYTSKDLEWMESLLDTELLARFSYSRTVKTQTATGNYEIFTVANDKMAKNLATLLYGIKENSGLDTSRVRVIPFDDNIQWVREICAAYNVQIVEPSPKWDRLGKILFKDEEYRPNVPAWRYFRKLNALSHAKGRYIFVDANCIILSSLIPIFDALARNDVIFGNYSAKNRNFKPPLEMLLNVANPKIKQGFNAGFWGTTFDPKLLDSFKALMKPEIRSFLTKSPEQSVLSIVMALSGKKISKLGDACPSLCVASANKKIANMGDRIVSKGRLADYTVVSMKWTGVSMHLSDDMPNKDIYLHYLNGSIAWLLQKKPHVFGEITKTWVNA